MKFKDFQECYFKNNEDCVFREYSLHPMGSKSKCAICGKHDDKICIIVKKYPNAKYKEKIIIQKGAYVHLGCLNLGYSLKEKKIFQEAKYLPPKEKKIRKGLPKECYTCKSHMKPEERGREDSLYCKGCAYRTGRTELFNHPFFIKHRNEFKIEGIGLNVEL